jgi:hypothetical protein
MSEQEQRCQHCKWFRYTSAFTSPICAMPVPYWVQGSATLSTRAINSLQLHCPTWEAKP